MILAELLRKKHSIQDVYFQDPRFSTVDISFLRSIKYHVLNDPLALEIIDLTSVFAPGLHGKLCAQAFTRYCLAPWIGNNLEARCIWDPKHSDIGPFHQQKKTQKTQKNRSSNRFLS